MTNNSGNLSVNNFGKICRTCLAEGEMKFLYQNCSEDNCLLEMLMAVTFVQFTEKDGLPVQVCLDCEKEARRAYCFAQKCLEVDKQLKTCLNEFQSRIENKTNSTTPTDFQMQENEPEIVIEENTEDFKIEHNYSGKEDIIGDKLDEENQEEILEDDTDLPESENSDSDSKTNNENCQNPSNPRLRSFGPPYVCKKCFEVFPNFKLLRLHWQEAKHPSNSRTTCKICKKSIHWSKLCQHLKTHTSEKAFGCDTCGKRFNIKANLKRHQMIHTGEKPHQCPQCGKAFIQSFHLNVHIRTHTGETPFSCNECGKRFSSKGGLRIHSKIHLSKNENPSGSETSDTLAAPKFECEVCHRFYKTKEILASHRVIHGEKKFLCSECGRSFYSKAALLSHSYLHTGLKPLTCDTCNKKFRHVSTLNVHKLLHTGQKPFLCDICNRRFTQRHHLTYHLRTHSGEKPYSCTFCDKSFALNNNLKVHIRTHTGETPYLCPVCGRGFYDSSSMKKHAQGHGKQSKISK